MSTFKCTTCKKTADFKTKQDASLAGWTMAELYARGRIVYVVQCPGCGVPGWADKLLADKAEGAKHGKK